MLTARQNLPMLLCIALVWGLPCSTLSGQEQPAKVVVSAVVERSLSAQRSIVGTIMPRRTSLVGSGVDGRVVELLVREGDTVKQGQPLARLRTSSLQLQLAGAQAELTLRQQELAELENGATLEELAQSRARMEAALASKSFTSWKYKQVADLFAQGQAATESDLQQSLADSQRDQQLYLQAKALYDLTIRGPRPERIAQAQAQLLVQQRRVDVLDDQILRHTIEAPFAGHVTKEHTELGQWLREGEAVVQLVQLSEVDVVIPVLAEDVGKLQLGTAVRVDVPALPQQLLNGSIAVVVPLADAQARTFPVKVRVVNQQTPSGPLLKAGMIARVALPAGPARTMTLVPRDAIVLGGEKPVVYLVEEAKGQVGKMVARRVVVRLGISADDMIQVEGDLKKGERVAVLGNERLRPGQQVAIQPAQKP